MKSKNFLLLIAAILSWIAVIAVLASCSTSKRIAQAKTTLDEHPKERAEYCASNYKPVERTTIKTVYKPGKPVLVPGETVYVEYDCDSAVQAEKSKVQKMHITKIRIPVPVYKEVDTSAIEAAIDRENVAAMAVAEIHYDSLNKAFILKEKECADEHSGKVTWRKWAYSEGLALFLLIATSTYTWYNRRKIAALRAAGKYLG